MDTALLIQMYCSHYSVGSAMTLIWFILVMSQAGVAGPRFLVEYTFFNFLMIDRFTLKVKYMVQ
jgi:hypothetical protein